MEGMAAELGGGVGMSLLSGLSGLFQKHESQDSTSRINAGSATASETSGQNGLMDAFKQLQDMIGVGPNQSDVSNATASQRSLADMFQQYSQTGGLPTASDISNANGVASNLFAPQQTALSQAFLDQTTNANRQAALMGRSVNDPILQAKLATEQTRQQAMLGANQGAFAQQFALAQPMQRLGFAQQYAGIQSGLATQAMNNRQALAAMGEGIMNNERNFRLQTATRSNSANQYSGGGFGGMINGMIAGAGVGMNTGRMFGMGNGTGGGYSVFGNAPKAGEMGPPAPTFFNGGF